MGENIRTLVAAALHHLGESYRSAKKVTIESSKFSPDKIDQFEASHEIFVSVEINILNQWWMSFGLIYLMCIQKARNLSPDFR